MYMLILSFYLDLDRRILRLVLALILTFRAASVQHHGFAAHTHNVPKHIRTLGLGLILVRSAAGVQHHGFAAALTQALHRDDHRGVPASKVWV